MSEIPDYTDDEISIIENALRTRWKNEKIKLHPADVEVKMSAYSDVLTDCPALFWTHKHCNFIIIKAGENRFRTQFFYEPSDQYGTGRNEYHSLQECVTSVLQVQADHETLRDGTFQHN